MRLSTIFLILSLLLNAGKVNWDSKGKPQIEKSVGEVKGCFQRHFNLSDNNITIQDNNSTCNK